MIVGIPKEIKNNENRVAITPAGVVALIKNGHSVIIETKAGEGSGFTNEMYQEAGAKIIESAAEVFSQAEMIMKVKEPQAKEYDYFKEGQLLFTYLHSAAEPEMTRALLEKKVVGISYDTVQLPDGSLPLLAPMSEIAGKMATQVGAQFLEKPKGGRGVLLGGVPGVAPAHVVIIGGGVVGTNAAKIAVGMGARVSVVDVSAPRLRYLDDIFSGKIETVMSSSYAIKELVKSADLLIGAVLIPGTKAPHLVTEDMVKEMKPGSVIVDVAIDQGGCIETCNRVTTHSEPTYCEHEIVHYSVANMPGAVARTSTMALTNVTLPYAIKLANKGWKEAIKEDAALAKGANIVEGKVTYKAVSEALGIDYTQLDEILA